MAYAALLLGLVLPVFVQGLVEQPRALRLDQRSGPQSKVTKDSDRGPEAYGSWANAWDNGAQAEAGEVYGSALITSPNKSANNRLPSEGLIRSCFSEWTCQKWRDDKGEPIEAHGAGFLKDPIGGRWYWYGESRKTKNLNSHGVNCYSAASLAGPWRREGAVQVVSGKEVQAGSADPYPQVMRQHQIKAKGLKGPFVVERPKVLFNAKTKKFVMWFHLDGETYKYRHVGIATADAPEGPFTFVKAIKPDGIPSLDMSLWVDVDGQAYFVRSCNNEYTGISRLRDDYLDTTGLLSKGPRLEGMALFRLPNGTLYMMTSHLTGWNPNPLMLYRANGPDLSDPQWQDLGNPTRQYFSFNTQPTYVVPYTTQKGETYFVYMADNWIHGGTGHLLDASYVWLPIKFEGGNVFIDQLEAWDMEDPWKDVDYLKRPVFG
jgi:beta-galactosidase